MSASPPNTAIIAAAGSRKTQHVIDTALAVDGRVAVVTYTNENSAQIIRRIEANRGTVPPNIHVIRWLPFLLSHGAKPFQAGMTGVTFALTGLNFDGEPGRFTRKSNVARYYMDHGRNLYACNLANFVVEADRASRGAVMDRLGRIYDAILIDEVQDLVGWDLDVIDLLIDASPRLLMVGDPRQHTYGTNRSAKNKKYRGAGFADWLQERSDRCPMEVRTESYRCHQEICDFADAIYPEMPATTSMDVPDTGHDGVFTITRDQVREYVAEHRPAVLRPRRDKDTLGLPAMNIGVAKGSTFDRVLIFPTERMQKFLTDRDPSVLKEPERLYVAVTRARFSATFVV